MKKYLFLLMSLGMLFLTGCSKVKDQEQILADLKSGEQITFLKDGEHITEFVITERHTEKAKKTDIVCCEVTVRDEICESKKEVELAYTLDSKEGWILDDLDVNDSDEWLQTPIKGVSEDVVALDLIGRMLEIDYEYWVLTKDNIKSVSFVSQETKLNEKKDEVKVAVIIDAEFLELEAELQMEYVFDNGWKNQTISDVEKYQISLKPEYILKVTDAELISIIAEQDIYLEEEKTGGFVIIPDAYTQKMHTVSIEEDEISDFSLDEQKVVDGGARNVIECHCTLTKSNATFLLNTSISYQYSRGDGWKVASVSTQYSCASVDIIGEWTGTYNDAPFGGTSILTISDMDENGNITGIYSYTPAPEDSSTKPGSYQVSGTINMSTLDINLKAGDWIDKPLKVYTWSKGDIIATLCVDEATMKGVAQGSCPFVVKRQ